MELKKDEAKNLKVWQIVLIVLCGIGLVCSFMLFLPAIQNLILGFGEKLIHRPFNYPDVWIGKIKKFGEDICFFFIICIAILFVWRFWIEIKIKINSTDEYEFTEINKSSHQNTIQHKLLNQPILFFAIASAVSLITGIIFKHTMFYILCRFIYVFSILFLVYAVRPNGILHLKTFEKPTDIKTKLIIGITLGVCILLAILPMSLNPIWNGEIPDHRNQYEEMADAILSGHLYIDNGNISQELLSMENPYDTVERENKGMKGDIDYEWDHAFYKGHYYMYFGVVPVFLLFIPYKLLFNVSLTTYHATQIFTSLIIIGIFILLYLFVKKYSKKITLGVYLSLSVALSLMSVYYFTKYPALYCTAISSGVCFALWGFIILFKALVLDNKCSKYLYLKLFAGALCSALVFGCRPPIGMLCVVYVPMWIMYIKTHKDTSEKAKTIKSIIIFCIPFIIVATLLMIYNYLRFDNPFEFGQTYQLTSADQSSYMRDFMKVNILKFFAKLFGYFVIYPNIMNVSLNIGVIILFPIIFLIFPLFRFTKFNQLKNNNLFGIFIGLMVAVFLIITLDITWAPFLSQRYSMDFIFVICISIMIAVCMEFQLITNVHLLQTTSFYLTLLCMYTSAIAFFMFFRSGDSSFVEICPEQFKTAIKFLTFQ